MKKTLVISGINLVDGGAYSVFCDCLSALIRNGFCDNYRIIALVGKKQLFDSFKDKIELVEFPKSKKSWLFRLYYEYIFFHKLSKKIHVNTWISLHDMTPNVIADKQYVYCHNPSPFNKMKIRDARFGLKYYLFSKFYRFLYAFNIHKNDAVIVQQDWMRSEFVKMYNLDEERVIVARPSLPDSQEITDVSSRESTTFIFPSFPRYYKNFGAVCKAAVELNSRGISNFKVYITLDGTENSYSRSLRKKFGECASLVFCGLLKRPELYKLYGRSNALIFLSKIETWGMPITEYKQTGKPMIVSDLSYAHETVGNYEHVAFVDVDDVNKVAEDMKKVIDEKDLSSISNYKKISEPVDNDWCSLFNRIL